MGNTVRLYDILQLLDPRSFVIIIGKPTVESKLENSPLHCGNVEDILDDIKVNSWMSDEVLALYINCDGAQEIHVLHKEEKKWTTI